MKANLDQLMDVRNLAALVVVCGEQYSAPRDYLTGGVKITGGLVIKKQGDAPVIFAGQMEIDEAAKTGLKVYSYNDLNWPQIYKDAQGDRIKADVTFWGKALEAAGVSSGKVGIYGVGDFNVMIELVGALRTAYPQYEFVGETGLSIFDEAYSTKDAGEIARMREVARKTNEAMQATWDYVRGQRVEDGALVQADGAPFTIGDVKRFLRRSLLDMGLEESGVIFAQGRDGAFPHSRGEADMQLRLGQSIVFDLFPHEAGGGYYHDMTRTWCLGYAPPEVEEVYQHVMDAFDIAVEVFRPGIEAKELNTAVEDYFESKGHPTSRSAPGTMDGYVHSLGHGVGLKIHERPSMNSLSPDKLVPGNIVTIEPGLYYPDRGYGVRIEDTFYVDDSGQLISLTPFRKDLVVPIG